MSEELMPNLYRLPVPLKNSPLKLLNSYLICGERNLLIDTGYRRPECFESLTSQLAELGVDMAKTDILLTHLHADHTGLAPELAQASTHVYISSGEMPWMLHRTADALWRENEEDMVRFGFPRTLIDRIVRRSAENSVSPRPEFQNYLPIAEGDTFSCGEYTLCAVSTPGHTPGSLCFWMEKQKTMFTGDHVLFDISPNITSWAGVTDPLGDYLQSLHKIDRYDVQIALPGHRETGRFHPRVAALLQHHKARLADCLEIVKRKPCQTVCDVAGQMHWKMRGNSWEDFPMSQKWFAGGETASHLQHLEARGLIAGDRSSGVIRGRVL